MSDIVDDSDLRWIVRGTAVKGRDAVLRDFQANYEGTWVIAPDFDKMDITDLAPDIEQIVVPAAISVAPAGQDAWPNRFLLTQIYVERNDQWKLATIITVRASVTWRQRRSSKALSPTLIRRYSFGAISFDVISFSDAHKIRLRICGS